MSNSRKSPSLEIIWWKNPWFWVAAFAVLGMIGSNLPPDDSNAAPAPIIESVAVPAPAPVPVTSTEVAPAPIIESPAIPAPITNNNVIVLGHQDIPALLERLPVPAFEPPAPEPEPRAASEPRLNRTAMVPPDCLDEMAAHHRKVAEFYDRMTR